jgi:hypothetical protein
VWLCYGCGLRQLGGAARPAGSCMPPTLYATTCNVSCIVLYSRLEFMLHECFRELATPPPQQSAAVAAQSSTVGWGPTVHISACSARVKAIEDAPPAPLEGQPPQSPWQAAGTHFAVQLRLARPLYAPWQPPARPDRQLVDVFPAKAPAAPLPAPTAADRFRTKVR